MIFLNRTLMLIADKGITKNKLLTDLKISKNSFVAWENRGTVPSGDTLAKIADYFNVSVDYLLGRTDYPEINNGQVIIDGKTIEGTIHKIDGGYIIADPDADVTNEDIEEIRAFGTK